MPLLVKVTVCAADVVPRACFAKANDVALNFTAGELALAAMPVPVSETVCGEPEALSVMLTLAALAPVETGVNLTDRVQLALAASVVPQVLDRLKSSACPPVNATELSVNVDVPLLVSVTVFAADVVAVA